MTTAARFLCLAFIAFYPPGESASPAPAAGADAATELRRAVTEQLAAGRVSAALTVAQAALAKHPTDRAVQNEFIELHMSLAATSIRQEDFAVAMKALDAVRAVDPRNREAGRLDASIESARKAVPDLMAKAKEWSAVEWNEPAFRACAQATALEPARSGEWAEAFRQAAVAAGDDHYFTKNFHEAFYCYDTALQLAPDEKADVRLQSRWLQSLVHALNRDVDRVGYPPTYWAMILKHVEASRPPGEPGRMMSLVVRGMACEDLGDVGKATAAYAAAAGTSPDDPAGDPRKLRDDAIRACRKWYDPLLSDRRRGIWRTCEPGPWLVTEDSRFRIRHHNQEAADRVYRSLAFHFERIAGLLGVKPDEVPWNKPCEVFLYADGKTLRRDTGQRDNVQAFSVIRHRGSVLDSHAIHVSQDDPLLLSTTLAHELAHLMVGAATSYHEIPATVSEGLALVVEPRCRQLQMSRVFITSRPRPPTVDDLLRVTQQHPAEPAFYAGSLRLVQVLNRSDSLLDVIRRMGDATTAAELADRIGFPTRRDLEVAYYGR